MVYLAAAFIIMWVMVTAYVLFLNNRQRQLEQELDVLQELLQDKQKK